MNYPEKRKSRVTLPDGIFSPPLDNNFSWVLGLLLTDGNIFQSSKNNYRITLVSTDEDVVHKIQYICKCGNIQSSLPKYPNAKFRWTWRLSSSRLGELLYPFGMVPNKSKILKFPDISQVHFPSFVRGLWDGDGTIFMRSNGKFTSGFCSASEDFIVPLVNTLQPITKSTAKPRLYKNTYIIQYSALKSKNLLNWIYADSASYNRMERKYSIYSQYCEN